MRTKPAALPVALIAVFFALSCLILPIVLPLCAHAEDSAETADSGEINHKAYETTEPTKAFGVRIALNAFPIKTAIGSTYQAYGEYILPFHQLGLISIGAHAGIFPLVTLDNSLDSQNYSSIIAGLQATYQFRIIQNQWVVPTVSLDFDWMRLKYSNGNALTLTSFGGSAGAMILLTSFDSTTSKASYAELGMVRAYLTLQWQPLTLTTASTEVEGALWYMGVRLEFE